VILLLLLHVIPSSKPIIALLLDLDQTQLARFLGEDLVVALDHLVELYVPFLELLHSALEG